MITVEDSMEIGCVVFEGPASDMFIFGLLGGFGIIFLTEVWHLGYFANKNFFIFISRIQCFSR